MRVFVIGGSGAIGRPLVSELLRRDDITSVVSFGRRSNIADLLDPTLTVEQKSKLKEVQVDFEKFEQYESEFKADPPFSVGFCTLGTTIKDAGSKDVFKKVDHDYVINVARVAKANGVPRFSIVTAQNSDSKSLFFYCKVKGDVEQSLTDLQFPSLTILRPALLDAQSRPRSRPLERLAINIFGAINFMLPHSFRSIPVETVARAAVRLATTTAETPVPVRRVNNAELLSVGQI